MPSEPEIRRSDATPGTLLLVGGGALGAAGLLMLGVSIQFMAWWTLPTWATVGLWAQALLGVTALVVARLVADGRPWAAIVGTVLAPLIVLVSTAWAGWALWNVSFTLFMLFTPPVSAVATVLVPFTIRPALRCAAARKVVTSEVAKGGLFGGVG